MIQNLLTMIPGPTPVHESILAELSRPTTSHQDPAFVRAFRECLGELQRIAMAGSAQPFMVAGSGTLAMEMALVNLVRPEDKLLILSQGFFGDRYAQLAEAFGLRFELVQAEWGRATPPEELERRLTRGGYAAVAMTHVDTSTGAAAPIESYCSLLRGREELIILDGVCATGGMEERFDEWGLDVLLTGAQKALGAPPGLALLLVSPRALQKRRSSSDVRAYYADLLRWLPIMEDPARYFSTPPVNEVVALRAALRILSEEGLPARFLRHSRIARAIRAGLGAAGLELFTAPDCLADTLSVVRYATEVDDATFRTEMARRRVIVAGGLGPIAGKAFRIGHMGNIGTEEVCRLLQAVEGSLMHAGRKIDSGVSLAAAAPHLDG